MAKVKFNVLPDENGQYSDKSPVVPVDSNYTGRIPKFSEGRLVSDSETEAYDPGTDKVLNFRDSDTTDRARMRADIQENPYQALKRGYFAAQPIDANDTGLNNFMREAGRTIWGFGYNLPQNMELNAIGSMHAMSEMPEYVKKSSEVLEKAGFKPIEDNDVQKNMKAFLDTHKDEINDRQQELFKQVDKHNQYIESKLGMNRGTFMGDLGGAAGSLAVMVGASAVAGPYGATAAAMAQGMNTSGSNYRELIEAGIDPSEAFNRAFATGMSEAVLERIGIGLMFDTAGKKIVQRALIGFITESSEEFSQNLSEDLIMQKVRGKSVAEILSDAGYAGLLGGITGGVAGTVSGGASLNPQMRTRYVKELTDRGLEQQQAEQLLDKVTEHFNEQEVVGEMNAVVQEQTLDDQYPDGDFGKAFDTWQAIAKDELDTVRRDIDIRDEVKRRAMAGNIDEATAGFTADMAQQWADASSKEFGITPREILENTGLAFNNQSEKIAAAQPTKLDNGMQISPTGELMDANGNILFQRAPANIETSEFNNWFGDSKVVDNSGKPLVVYHGTNAEFYTFEKRIGKQWYGKGFYFTENQDIAEKYGNNVIKGYLSIQNPVIFKQSENELFSSFLTEKFPETKGMTQTEQQEFLQNNGYDGISVILKGQEKPMYIAFEPNQIKSVNNNGDFDSNNNNIYYQQAQNDFKPTDKDVRDFTNDLNEAINSKDSENTSIRVMQLPSVYEAIGISSGLVNTNKRVIVKDAIEKHAVKPETIKRLPELFADPLMVFESATVAGRYVAVIDAKDKNGNQIVVALAPNENRDGGYHFIPSFYGKDKFKSFVENNIIDGKLKYIKGSDLLDTLQLRPQAKLNLSDENILQKSDIVKRFYQNEERIRGYLDWNNLGAQLVQIMKSGDRDTVVHELAHFFTINYANMAIQTDKTENLQAIMDYYNVSDPSAIMRLERIQEDLARKFLTYIKTDESPRGFRKYFDEIRDWLVQVWNELRGRGMVDDAELSTEVTEFFDTITNARMGAVNMETIQQNKSEIKQLLKDVRAGKNVRIGNLDLKEVEGLIKVANQRLPRAPKSLYSKLWGNLNRRFAETHDLGPLMGVDEKSINLMTKKQGGISNENDLIQWMVDEGFIFGQETFTDASESQAKWDEALRLMGNARNAYSVDDAMKIQEREQISQMKDEARDILDGADAYDALAHLEALRKKNVRLASADEVQRAVKRLNTMESDYKRLARRMAKQKADEVDSAKKSAVNFLLNQDLPEDVKNKYFRKINSVRDLKTLSEYMQDVRENAYRTYSNIQAKYQSEQIQNEIKQSYSRNMKAQKYDYENNQLFKTLREYNRMTQADARNEWVRIINEKPEGTRDRSDELKLLFLSYKEKGMTGFSSALGDKLLFELQAAKQIGLQAKDDLEFDRGMKRVQMREDVLDSIEKTKAPTAVQRGYLAVGANFKTAVNMMVDSKIADELDMVPRETEAAIDGKKRINAFLDDAGPRIFGLKTRSDFIAKKQEWLKPIDGLRIWSLDPSGRKVFQNEVSMGQIMNIYNQYKNADSKKAMDYWYGESQINELIGMLNPQDKQFADEMMDYIDDVHAMVNPIYVDVYQTDLGKVFNYWPRRSEHVRDQDLLSDFVGPSKDPNFTKHRSQGAKPVFRMDALSVWMNHELDAQYMIHQARNFKKISDTFRDPTVENEIRNKWGKKSLAILHEQIDSMSINGVRQSRNEVEGLVTKLVGQFSLAKIAVNPLVLGGQLSAYHAYSTHMPTAKYYADLTYAISHIKETHKFMRDNVGEFLDERLHGGFNETLKSMLDYEKTGATQEKLNRALSSFVRYADYASVVWGGYPRLKFLINEKDANGNPVRTKEAAARQFMVETQETMQANSSSSLSAWQRSKGMAKLFTIFKNQQNQYVRKIFEAFSEYGRGEISRGKMIKQVANFAIVQSALFAVFRYSVKFALGLTGDDDDMGEDIFEAVALGNFDILPFISDIASQELRRMQGKNTIGGVSVLGVDDIYKSFSLLHKKKSWDWHDYAQIVSPFIEMSSGLPVAQYNRYLKKWGF